MKEKGKEEGERTRGMRLAEEQCNRVVDQSPRHPPLKILRHLGRVATEIATWLALGIRNNNGSLLKPYPAYRPVKRVTRIAFFFSKMVARLFLLSKGISSNSFQPSRLNISKRVFWLLAYSCY